MKNNILTILIVALIAFSYFTTPYEHADYIFKMGFTWAALSLLFCLIVSQVIKISFICRDGSGNEYTRWGKSFIILQGLMAYICLWLVSAGAVLLLGQHAPAGTSGSTWAILATMLWATMLPFVLIGRIYGKWLKTWTKLVSLYFIATAAGLGGIASVRALTQWDKSLCVLIGVAAVYSIAAIFTCITAYKDVASSRQRAAC